MNTIRTVVYLNSQLDCNLSLDTNHYEKNTYVAPATANSFVLLFISNDNNITNMFAARITIASLALRSLIALHKITGLKSSRVTTGAMIVRVILCVNTRGRM